MYEKALSQVLGFFGGVATAPDVNIKRVPVDSAELPKGRPESGRLTLARQQYHGPPSRTKSVSDVPERAFDRFHWSPDAGGSFIASNPNPKPNPISPKTQELCQLFLENDFGQPFQNAGPRQAAVSRKRVTFGVQPSSRYA